MGLRAGTASHINMVNIPSSQELCLCIFRTNLVSLAWFPNPFACQKTLNLRGEAIKVEWLAQKAIETAALSPRHFIGHHLCANRNDRGGAQQGMASEALDHPVAVFTRHLQVQQHHVHMR